MQCVTWHDVHPIAKTVALKLGIYARKVTSIVRLDSSFDAIEKSVINFSVASVKERAVY